MRYPARYRIQIFSKFDWLGLSQGCQNYRSRSERNPKWFPQFFEVDPFWRERPYPIKNHNAFDEVKVNVASYRSWLPQALEFAGDEAERLIGKTSKRPWNNVKFLASEKKWCDWQYHDV